MGNARKAKEQSSAFRAFLCVGVRLAPRFAYSWKFGAGFCPAGFLPAAGNRRWAFCLPGKTEARREPAPGNNRVRARRGVEKTGCGLCSPLVCAYCRPQVRAFCLPGKTGAQRGRSPGTSRVRAQLGADTNRVRELLTAGAGGGQSSRFPSGGICLPSYPAPRSGSQGH